MSDDVARLLYQGALAVTEGRKEQARELLMKVLELDEMNEQAWLWLSGAVDEPGDQQIALENVLAINPNNAAAQEGMAALQGGNGGWVNNDDWIPPEPLSPDDALEFACWKCNATVYSVAQFCWQCHAPIHSCANCQFISVTRCKELQGLSTASLQNATNTCEWWRPA